MGIETVRINYWKGLNSKDLEEILEDVKGLLFLIYNDAEISDIIDFLERIRPKDELDILYISLLRSYYHIKMELEEKKIDKRRLFIVDCVSSMIMDVDESSVFAGKEKIEGIFRRAPGNFNHLKDIIKEGLNLLKSAGIGADVMVVDSISNLVNLSFPTEVTIKNFYRFMDECKRELLGIMHDTLILLYNDRTGYLKNVPMLHADHVLKMEVIKEEPKWEG